MVAAVLNLAGILAVGWSAAVAAQSPRIRPDTIADTTKVFRLGTIQVTGENALRTGVLSERRSAEDLQRHNRRDLAQGLNLFSGVTLSNVGPRNESGVYVRGFDLRQVPVLVDGIPVYVPYDGYVDLGRFTTYDASEIQVSKGMSSVLLGPNALGGAINLVSRRPTDRWEATGGFGAFGAGGRETYLNLGTRQGRWYAQGSGSYLTQDAFRLSDDFAPVVVQGQGERANAYRTDWKLSGKFGFTPRTSDEYAVGFATQNGEKGNPPYAGTDPTQPVRFWRWPQWDKRSVYLITQTALTDRLSVRTRGYYDRFLNQLNAYDDATYTTQNRGSSFQSFYDDDIWGGVVEGTLALGPRLTLAGAAHAKLDNHRENNLGEPQRRFTDRTLSFGLEAQARPAERLTMIAGVSRDERAGLHAENLEAGAVSEFPTSSSGTWNPQLAALYQVGSIGTLRASVSRKTRFPTLKDRYSYRLGSAIPNPDLTSEGATHLELGYVGVIGTAVTLRASGYYSRIDDLIQRVDDVERTPTNQALFQLQNVGDARNQGFELGVDARAAAWLTAGASYSFLDRKNITRPEVRLIDTPKSKWFSFASVMPARWFEGVVSIEWNSRRFTTTDGATVEPFAVVGIKGVVTPLPWLSAEVAIQNLFDTNYELIGGFPEPGRMLYLNLRYDLARRIR